MLTSSTSLLTNRSEPNKNHSKSSNTLSELSKDLGISSEHCCCSAADSVGLSKGHCHTQEKAVLDLLYLLISNGSSSAALLSFQGLALLRGTTHLREAVQPCSCGFYRWAWPQAVSARKDVQAGAEVPHPHQHRVQAAVMPWGIGVTSEGNTCLLTLHCLYISSQNRGELKQRRGI